MKTNKVNILYKIKKIKRNLLDKLYEELQKSQWSWDYSSTELL